MLFYGKTQKNPMISLKIQIILQNYETCKFWRWRMSKLIECNDPDSSQSSEYAPKVDFWISLNLSTRPVYTINL